ncbi:MAG: PAS domain S-box protein [Candidatus Methylomirabilis oxyfera]|nr:PAS domain S-box protein [Candidatus Methylomirabilis oxyfera]
MPFLRDVPIRQKLARIVQLALTVALGMGAVVLLVVEFQMYRSVMTKEMRGIADVIGTNSRAALTFQDPAAGERTLAALGADPRVMAARLYTKEGHRFATYRRSDVNPDLMPATAPSDGLSLRMRSVTVVQPIRLDGERIGTIYLQFDMAPLYDFLLKHALVVIAVLGLASLVALVLSSRLQGVISGPVVHLAAMVKSVTEKDDYTVRAVTSGQDELGLLTDGFNEMLARIQERDAALQQAREGLEERVACRTRELQIEIAERRRAEEQLRKLSGAVEQATDGVLITDREGVIEYVNPAFERLTGYSRDEAIGRTPRLVKSGHQTREYYEKLWQILLSGEVFRDVLVNRKKDGTLYFEETVITPLRDSQGAITHFVSVGRDITERKQAEAALAESEEKYRTLIEVSQDAIFINRHDHIVYVNPATLTLLGAEKPEQVIGKSPFDFIHPRYHDVVRDRIRSLLDKGESVSSLEEQYVRLDGTVIDVEVAATSLTYKDGTAIQVVVRDITERKRAEQEVRDSREQLRALAAHLESVREDERTQISREIHDELGQLLTGLKIDLSWVARQLPGDKGALQAKVRTMGALIDTTIQSVRRIAGELRPGLLDDLGLMAAVEWQAQEFQSRTGIRVHLTAAPSELDLDREYSTALFRIMQEALTNVARHAQATVVYIALKADAERLLLEVIDNGTGITPDALADRRAFGLLGMRERALLLGGQVVISGRPGQGTTVTLVVPLKRPATTHPVG